RSSDLMVYPALIASVADHTHPSWRAQGLGVYRFWRDLRYAPGAEIAGLVAAAFGLSPEVAVGGALTLCSGLVWARWLAGDRSRGPPRHAGRSAARRLDG